MHMHIHAKRHFRVLRSDLYWFGMNKHVTLSNGSCKISQTILYNFLRFFYYQNLLGEFLGADSIEF